MDKNFLKKYFVVGLVVLLLGVGVTTNIYVITANADEYEYTVLWQVDLPKESYFKDYRAESGDTDSDGKDEIAFIAYDSHYGAPGDYDPLILVDDDGSIIWSEMLLKERCCLSIEDFDLDGEDEIFVGATDRNYYGSDGHVWAFNGDGSLIWEYVDIEEYGFWTIVPGYFVFKNIDQDDNLEIIMSNTGHPNKNNYALDADNNGNLIWRNNRRQGCDALLADLNNDGDDEYILLTSIDKMVYVINPYNGDVINSVKLINYNRGAVGDINGDGIDDLFIVSKGQDLYSSDKIYAIKNDLSIIWSKNINDDYGRYPILEDIDEDGKMDIILSENNKIMAWKSDGSVKLWESYAPFDFWQLWRFDIDADGVLDIIFFADKAVYKITTEGVISKVFDLDVSNDWKAIFADRGKVTPEKSRLTTRLVSADTNDNGIEEFLIEEVFSDYVRVSVIEPLVPVVEVSIDIKPGSYPNSVNPKSNGKLPLAILTTEDFDAYDVNPDSIDFLSASPLMWAMEDVDEDGDMDMILHFKIKQLDFSLLVDEGGEYPYAYLYGETIDGQSIEGRDTVRLVGQWELLIENIYTKIVEIIQWIIHLIIR